MKQSASWVVVEIATGKAIFETFSLKTANRVNMNKYRVVPILEYLVTLNRQIKENS